MITPKTEAQLQEEHELEMQRLREEEAAREAEQYDEYCFQMARAEDEAKRLADAEAAEAESEAAWHAWSGQ